ncbi:MAG: DEAD/DEAH box helicase, partial [Patescibacteria group bacterium]|nr:DEAD/DEAH box helicase [Patescibacteria group bacterium]
ALEKGQALILIPTRELALQVDETLKQIGTPLGLKTAVIIGGASANNQIRDLKRNPHVIIATPGRLMDHLEQKVMKLDRISIVVLDEADRMFDIGFFPVIKRILGMCPQQRQTLMFSATMPPAIANLAAQFMQMPLRIEVAPAGTTAAGVEQEVFVLDKQAKLPLLEKILTDNKGTVLVFSRTKHGAKKITAVVRAMGHTVTEIHSNRSLAQRKDAMAGFKSGKYRVLVATDIAARGIDVTGISLVVNFDMPQNAEDYVHRIGRTARAGTTGKAVSFATPDQRGDIRQIERLIKKTIPILALPTLPRKSDAVIRAESMGGHDRDESPRQGGRRFSRPRSSGAPSGVSRGFSRSRSRPSGGRRFG